MLIFSILICLTSTVLATETKKFEFSSAQEVLTFFKELNYTEKSWDAGLREVPRVYLSHLPPLWKIDVKLKKELFFRVMTPLMLRSNELILQDREQLLELMQSDSVADQQWLNELAIKYRVIKTPEDKLTPAQILELQHRVDIIPPSLAMAQTAEESGWGTSRFAMEGNALFGQWTWGGKGITPKEQRKGKGNYKIAAFDQLLDSFSAYMLNLNTHPSYKTLRDKRASLRKNNQPLQGLALTETLLKYSERGQAYVDSLNKMIQYNKLDQIDEVYLGGKETIIMVPVGDGAG